MSTQPSTCVHSYAEMTGDGIVETGESSTESTVNENYFRAWRLEQVQSQAGRVRPTVLTQLHAFDQQDWNVQDQGATQPGWLRSFTSFLDSHVLSFNQAHKGHQVHQVVYYEVRYPNMHELIASRKRHERHGDTSNGPRGPLLFASPGNGSG
ncbi:hypothetical protein BKA56DRAFT_619010 [Ilyonectria sp. MPI-CAGE-AT-0026]|nr:hypothetical protein BKA56DRAFT_619010 [Ilyonectria sp. MPI-CAGE-AT-0026]